MISSQDRAVRTAFESDVDSPTDRDGLAQSAALAGFESVSTEDLRERNWSAIKAGRYEEARKMRRELQRRALERRRSEAAARQQRDENIERARAAAQQRGGVCELTAQGCPCAGFLDQRHMSFRDELRRPMISPETRGAIAALLGYPPKGARVKAIFGGTFGNGPAIAGFEWAVGALEEDWLTVLQIAERPPGRNGGPRRNPRDGSVMEGWVRAVLQNEIARRRDKEGQP